MPKENTVCYCATCGEVIKLGTCVQFSTTKTGTLKIHHTTCPRDEVEVIEVPDSVFVEENDKGFWARLFCK